MNCKNCQKPCELREKMFYYRGTYFTGWVCNDCNALYENKDDSIFHWGEE